MTTQPTNNQMSEEQEAIQNFHKLQEIICRPKALADFSIATSNRIKLPVKWEESTLGYITRNLDELTALRILAVYKSNEFVYLKTNTDFTYDVYFDIDKGAIKGCDRSNSYKIK